MIQSSGHPDSLTPCHMGWWWLKREDFRTSGCFCFFSCLWCWGVWVRAEYSRLESFCGFSSLILVHGLSGRSSLSFRMWTVGRRFACKLQQSLNLQGLQGDRVATTGFGPEPGSPQSRRLAGASPQSHRSPARTWTADKLSATSTESWKQTGWARMEYMKLKIKDNFKRDTN